MTLTLLNNRYQVLRVLGSGGFGETFLAEDTQMPSNRRCVIKQLKPVADNPQVYELIQQRFQQEAAILEELGDHNSQIPRLYAYFCEAGQFYLIQEYIEGQTLTQILQQQGVLSESAVKEILINILPILEYVHSKGIVHRDIKPDNIILRFTDGKPVLIDFGAVKVTMGTVMTTSGNSHQSIVIGTPGFMPMEQSVGRPVFASDLYSLGLTAIYLLTGKIPQELPTEPSRGDILWRHYAPHLSSNFADVLDRAIKASARDRFLNCREMLIALQTPVIPVAPTVPVSAPTVIANPSPVAYQPPTVVSPPIYQQPIPTQYPVASTNGLGTWQQAVIVGSVVGVFIVAGFWVMGVVQPSKETASVKNVTSPSPVSEPVISNSESPTTAPPSVPLTPAAVSQPTVINPPPQSSQQLNTTSSITQSAALEVLNRWLAAKREIFGPSLRSELGDQLLTGIVYTKFIRKTSNPDACLASGQPEDNCLSSVDWLRRNGAYWIYGVQKIDAVKSFNASGNRATIQVLVTEQRTLYTRTGRIDNSQSGLFTSTTSYDLEDQNGQIKISNYQ